MAIVTLVTCRELYDEFRDLQIVFHTKCKAPLADTVFQQSWHRRESGWTRHADQLDICGQTQNAWQVNQKVDDSVSHAIEHAQALEKSAREKGIIMEDKDDEGRVRLREGV
eukprot:CAMPEP_0195028088 /NCGR_PEP_ID=MMETSP0326_2-20130528/53687_1 /TAXON_ID=2866 ORGANISM="Crypthecodinium cohnii, Strain Seligo" /NCGR_SAMPLE_ID=MMETSP0326_2 /ASSEMBLY_ACC=CAM_ASM_000348 /LENGTH=110 /DNA_ID=CAMNT_0040050491 /DNA_START=170 /DNA_END=500 /DNA_ORIENTATION=-